MPTVACECTYCGHKWVGRFYDKQDVEDAACPKCGDTSLKIREHTPTSGDVFGYKK